VLTGLGPAKWLRRTRIHDDVVSDSGRMEVPRETEVEARGANLVAGERAMWRPLEEDATGSVQKQDVVASISWDAKLRHGRCRQGGALPPGRTPDAEPADALLHQTRAGGQHTHRFHETGPVVRPSRGDRVVITRHQHDWDVGRGEAIPDPTDGVGRNVLVLPKVPSDGDQVDVILGCKLKTTFERRPQFPPPGAGVFNRHSDERTVEVDIGEVKEAHAVEIRRKVVARTILPRGRTDLQGRNRSRYREVITTLRMPD
jgi:hypothetical protein